MPTNMHLISSLTDSAKTKKLTQDRLLQAKRAFSTRRADLSQIKKIITSNYTPKAGDLLLARVVSVGQHKRIERTDGRRSHLFGGDEIIVCYGNRYAPDQFEALVPENLGACDLAAAGGIAANVKCQHRSVSTATKIKPIGVLANEHGTAVNIDSYALPNASNNNHQPPVFAVIGTSMNAGKTTAAARLIRGLVRAGKQVAAAKITGTGAGGDYWMMMDAGASTVLDFTDIGFASTYCLEQEQLESILKKLVNNLQQTEADCIVIEIADGLLQSETKHLISGSTFTQRVDRIIFSAGDSMGAVSGYQFLQNIDCKVSAISGALTASPLAVREVEKETGCPVYLKTDLSNPEIAQSLINDISASRVKNNEASIPA